MIGRLTRSGTDLAMHSFRLTDEQLAQYHRDGFVFVEGLLSPSEADLLPQIARRDRQMEQAAYFTTDAQGGRSKISLSFELTDDIYSMLARCERIVTPVEQLLGDAAVHFHHKMMLKEPYVGGAWEWHQDYGYWYENQKFLYPSLLSCMVALDGASRDNGCLQVLRGSHHLGRINHGVSGGQAGADMARVQAAMQRLELVYCEMKPGAALFFHSNLLHRSDQNRSPRSRWSLIACYAAAQNPTIEELAYWKPRPLDKRPAAELEPSARRVLSAMQKAQAA
jgi:ectoine hydroxylase-related dioxygenase (phytanoyl-CoA dioxygenase family)